MPDDRHGEGLQISLRKQARKSYIYHQLEDIDDSSEIILLQFTNDDSFCLDESVINKSEAEHVFLTEQIEQCKAEYVFLTEQMNWKKGLRMFHKKGEVAITKELKQIHDMEGFQLKHWDELTSDQWAKALQYLMYLKEK